MMDGHKGRTLQSLVCQGYIVFMSYRPYIGLTLGYMGFSP
jgi:hypothetical protein